MTAFGGPAAHIAIMEDEVVRRRGWLSREKFLDLLGASNLIPGPSSSELAIHIGYQRAGCAGLVVAGCCFILPAAIMVAAIAWAYVRFGRLPAMSAVLYGVKPVVIAVILQALWGLARTAVKTKSLGLVGLASAGLYLLGFRPILLLLFAGTVVAFADSAISVSPGWYGEPELLASFAGIGRSTLRPRGRDGRRGGSDGSPRSRLAVSRVLQDRSGCFRERLRAACVFARRFGGRSRLAH